VTIRIGLADDQPLFRAGIRMILDSQDDFEVVWEASDGAEAVQNAESDPVDLILMDLEMPGVDGVEATSRILRAGLQSDGHLIRVVVLTTFELNDKTFTAIQ
jgi:DNA-binding NarL/FixJ family response regulator